MTKVRAQDQFSLVVPCPNCQAPVGEPCTQPTSTGRREVESTHLARHGKANQRG